MICRYDQDTVDGIDRLFDAGQLQIDRFHTDDRCLIVTGMSDHIAVWIVRAQEVIFTGLDRFDQLVGDLSRLHPRTLFKRNDIRLHFFKRLQLFIKLLRTVAIPEISDMSVLLCLADRILTDAMLDQMLRERVLDLRRVAQEVMRNVKVCIILQHTGIHHIRYTYTVELVKALIAIKGQ